ncbi:hypothetical protein [Belliella kenyensis]|uniref:hypothetical protein n=1 Tax=Belliella kenyensis TaxID=1472724 RepID=UPI00338F6668
MYPGLKDGDFGSDGAGIIEKIGSQVDQEFLEKEVIINPAMNWGDDPIAQSKDFKILACQTMGRLHHTSK